VEEAAAGAREPWTRRVTVWTQGFAEGLDLPGRAARLGALVRDHHGPARWAGIAIGALVLLFWPAPTLSVLIWIAALVALYLGALEWLRSRAPEPAPAEPTPSGAVPSTGSDGVAGSGAPVTPGVVPAPRVGPLRVDGATEGAPVATATAVEPVPTEKPLVPAALTPETISTLSNRLDLLVRLGAARDAGVLTDEEFSREKNQLLGV
jgi:hypothetical protein